VDSLIGALPDKWSSAKLGEVCSILAGPSGARLDLVARTSSTVPVVTPKDLRDNRIADDGVSAVALEAARELARYRLTAGDIVCSRTGDIGRQALAGYDRQGWLIGSACLRLRTDRSIDPAYLIYYLAHPAVQDWIARNATGSAIPSLNTMTLNSMPIAVPPPTIQSRIAVVLGALDEKVAVHEQISKTSSALRDSLLPLLPAGRGEA
jgi:type I restriction enzyme, S subunit